MYLGKYELHEEIGKGGFGTVYRATDSTLERVVALKVLHPALLVDSEYIERFRREAVLAARLEHAHIVPIYELGEVDGRVFLVMKYLPGGSLRKTLSGKGGLGYERSLFVLQQVASALDYAHARKVIHRDIKPGNILWEDEHNVRLSDFGFAKAMSSGNSMASSHSGGMVGTPAYMAPELWRNKTVGPATDIYSLACLFCEMISGEVLFNGESPADIITRHVLDGPQFPAEWPQGTPTGLNEVMKKALAREANERFATCTELVAALESLANRPFTPPSKPLEITKPQTQPSTPVSAEIKPKAQSTTPQSATSQPVADKEQAHSPATYPTSSQHKIRSRAIQLAEGVVMEFVRIPAGEFLMGAVREDTSVRADEKPQHPVMLNEYWMGRFPVTNAQYAEFVKTGRKAPNNWDSGQMPENLANHPVVNVSWLDANVFCEWLSAKSGLQIRLPTEAEWEKAARGTDGRIYPWGDQLPTGRFNFDKIVGSTSLVGKYSPGRDSPYGCADIVGNVLEWVEDWYQEEFYKVSPKVNPTGPITGEQRVLRGGAWDFNIISLRVSLRYRGNPSIKYNYIGFRCACGTSP